MRIIRFLDEQNQIHFGLETDEDRAQLLTGDLFFGLEPIDQTVPVARLLAPVIPSNIFCIGLNYREHAIESGLGIP